MIRTAAFLTTAWLSISFALAGQQDKTEGIRKEPTYRTKTPQYGALIFGSEGKDRVWLVRDGDVLYVDRNGNGDLTEPGKLVVCEKKPGRNPEEDGYSFEVGDIHAGTRIHKGLAVSFVPLYLYASGSRGKRSDVKALLAKNPKTHVVLVRVEVDVPGMKGNGIGGRLAFSAGPMDLAGVFQFAARPADAPHVWLDGPLQITFDETPPSLRIGRSNETYLVVGTPGIGAGTFATLPYEKTVPESVKPTMEISFPTVRGTSSPLKEKYEIRERC
jgi:hypothetical protein